MVVTSSGGSFTVPESDRPDSPIATRRSESTNPLRTQAGDLYAPVAYSFFERDLSFANITVTTVNRFKTMFSAATDFTIVDDELGTLSLVHVPGTLRVEYHGYNNASCFFTAADKVAAT